MNLTVDSVGEYDLIIGDMNNMIFIFNVLCLWLHHGAPAFNSFLSDKVGQ